MEKTEISSKSIFYFILISILCSFISVFNLKNPSILTLVRSVCILFILPGFSITILYFKNFNLQKILYSIILSMSFWSIIGILFFYFEVPLNSNNLIMILYPFETILILYYWYKNKNSIFEGTNIHFKEKINSIAINSIEKIKSAIRSNFFLLFIFIFVYSIFNINRAYHLACEDSWYHMKIMKELLLNQNVSSDNTYWGCLTYHYIWAIFSIFSKFDPLVVGKYSGIFQILMACLLFYSLTKYVCKNKNISIITTMIYSTITISSLTGTVNTLILFWPTSLIKIFGLQLLISFFSRYDYYQKNRTFNQKYNVRYYISQIILLICMLYTHITSLVIFLIPILFTLLIFSIKERRFLLELAMFSIFFVINILKIYDTSTFKGFRRVLDIQWYLLIIGIVGILFIFLKFYKWEEKFTYSFEKPLENFDPKENSSILIENKYFLRIIIPIVIIVLIIKALTRPSNYYYPSSNTSSIVLYLFFALIIATFIITALLYREYNLIGKILFLFLIFILFFNVSLIILSPLDSTIAIYLYRSLNLYISILMISVCLYLKYINETRLKKPKNRAILSTLVIFMLISSISFQYYYKEDVSKNEYDFLETTLQKSNPIDIEKQENLTTDVIYVGIVHYSYASKYIAIGKSYDFLYKPVKYFKQLENNNDLPDNISYLDVLENLTNSEDANNIFLIFDDSYFTRGLLVMESIGNYGQLNESEFNSFNNVEFLNRVAIGNERRALYWIR